MDLMWTWWAVPGVLGAWAAWAGAVVLLRTASESPVNRRLAAVLVAEGLWMHGTLFFMVGNEAVFMGIAVVAFGANAAIPFQYVAFLGAAVDTPLVRPFRSRIAWALLGLASVGAFAFVVIAPSRFIGELYSPPWAALNFRLAPLGVGVVQLHALASVVGLIASLHALVRAPRGTVRRSRAAWLAAAFGVRDAFNAFWWTLYPVYRDVPFWGDFLSNIAPMIVALLYIAILTYAVLRVQLFDLDLKLKFALRQGTVGTVVAGGFFVGSEWLESVVPVEGTLLGLLVAGVIVLLMKPLQKVAEGFASRVMRGVRDTPEYREGRKGEVYRAAVEGAVGDGTLTEREREILTHVRDKLGISRERAGELEREVAVLLGAR